MSAIEGLLKSYNRFVRLPWDRELAGQQRVWFAIYDPAQERRLRLRLPEFERVTREAGHDWLGVDLTNAFAEWLAAHEYREEYFQHPEDLELALDDFGTAVHERVSDTLALPRADERTVVAVSGVGSLFGLTRVSVLVDRIAPQIRGRLLIFFPGHRDGSNYRFLDARDGWNYLAVPIEATEGTER